jgi:hypothetical protein
MGFCGVMRMAKGVDVRSVDWLGMGLVGVGGG